ncbi:MAG TPA: SDR family NAD(P)-dependent oxidoreductase, partial [Chthoniobacterales bacterium]|nr:SDR family NAD(P)-dependent oxidoreductase [Chthoniobacterales bacterium]
MARQPRVALVTGANKGIGFEVARQLRREGFRVFLGARDERAGKAAADKLNKEAAAFASDHVTRHTSPVTCLLMDISKPDSIR